MRASNVVWIFEEGAKLKLIDEVALILEEWEIKYEECTRTIYL